MKFNFINILIDNNILIHLDTIACESSFVLFGFSEINQHLLNVNILAFKRLDQNCDQMVIRKLIKTRNLPKVLGILDKSHLTSYQQPLRSTILTEAGKSFLVQLILHDNVTIREIQIRGKPNSTIPVNLIIYNSDHLITSRIKLNSLSGLDESEEPICKFCIQTVEKYSLERRSADRFQIDSFVRSLSLDAKTTKDSTFKERPYSSLWFDYLLDYTTTGRLIYHRFEESFFCWNNFHNKHFNIKISNILSLITVDLLLSFLFFLIISQVTSPSHLLEACLQIMESIVSKVEQLIYNLIGMPAGLKLNRPLNTALGNFFLYHIHIWKAYITLIRPFLSLVLDLLGLISFFGITFVLGFFSDLISLASIHIYCFYGYAARLYCFQLSGLISLWRLFRGKKWNNLKHRVDSYSYGHDQLFIGTVCFTILIFLLPTILLYYSVFLFLRMISIVSQFIIKLAIEVILSIPFYGILLWTIGSSKIKTNIFFQIVNVKERQLTINMLFKSMTLGQIFDYHNSNCGNPFSYQKLLFIDFFLSIFTGSLI